MEVDLRSISLRKSDFRMTGREPVSRMVGGIRVWGESAQSLDEQLETLKAVVEVQASRHLSIARVVLKKLVVTDLGISSMEDRLFSAVLGAALRSGKLESVVCASKNDRGYRVYLESGRLLQWRDALTKAISLLEHRRVVQVRELERQIFGARAYNTWSSSSHVLAHLSYRGTVEMVAPDTFRLVELL